MVDCGEGVGFTPALKGGILSSQEESVFYGWVTN